MKSSVLALFWLTTIITAVPVFASEASTQKTYEQIYPEYAEYCGLSQITKVSTVGIKEVGGQGGHAVFLIRGACHDHSYSYPRLKVCEATDPLPHEVGTSVNSDFISVNWAAVDSKDFLFTGGIEPHERFDLAAYNRVQQQAQAMDIMNGVRIHPELFKNKTPGMTDVTYQYQDSIGTDYGVSLGRNMSCARVPINRQQIQEIVDYYNSRNDYYEENHIDFEWSFLNDNCSHLPTNALAEAGFWAPLKIDQPLPQALGNLAIPENVFVNIMRRSYDMPLEEPDELFRDEYARNGILLNGWLPTQPGALTEYVPVHQPNDIFATDLTEILFQVPVLDPAASDRTRFLTEARYTNIQANLEYFLKRYEEIKKNRVPIEIYTQAHGKLAAKVSDPAFGDFYFKYYQYIDQQIVNVMEKLQHL